jgi:hypothetical protein
VLAGIVLRRTQLPIPRPQAAQAVLAHRAVVAALAVDQAAAVLAAQAVLAHRAVVAALAVDQAAAVLAAQAVLAHRAVVAALAVDQAAAVLAALVVLAEASVLVVAQAATRPLLAALRTAVSLAMADSTEAMMAKSPRSQASRVAQSEFKIAHICPTAAGSAKGYFDSRMWRQHAD